MTSAAIVASNPIHHESVNLLNLMIVDDERAVREVCREVGTPS